MMSNRARSIWKRVFTWLFAGVSIVYLAARFIHPAHAHEGLVHDGCSPGQTFAAAGLEISGAFTRAMLPGARSAGGYMHVTNTGTEPDKLLGATTDASQLVRVHASELEGDVMKMSNVEDGLEIPAGGSIELAPGGGHHLMFMGVGTPFKQGECVEVTLQFEHAGDVPIVMTIEEPAAKDASGHDTH